MTVALRRTKRDDQLSKRRKLNVDDDAISPVKDNSNKQVSSPLFCLNGLIFMFFCHLIAKVHFYLCTYKL